MSDIDEELAKAEAAVERKRHAEFVKSVSDAVVQGLSDPLNQLIKQFQFKLQDIATPDKQELYVPKGYNVPTELSLEQEKRIVDAVKELKQGVAAIKLTIPKDVLDKILRDNNELKRLDRKLQDIGDAISQAVATEVAGFVAALPKPRAKLELKLGTNDQDPAYFLPVRLTNGKQFYEAIVQAVGGGGGGSGMVVEELKAINTKLAATTSNPVAKYRIADVDEGITVTYSGFMDVDGVWYILKEDATTNPTSYRYASVLNNDTITAYAGTGATKAWANRTTLTYGYFNEAF